MYIASKSWVQDLLNKVLKKAKSDDYFNFPKYATCTTAASTAVKVVNINDFTLKTGSRVIVTFTNMNKASAPRLNVNNTGSIYIEQRIGDQIISPTEFPLVSEFIYDGTYWVLMTSCEDIYSTNETCIGTWYDGNPIYRKVFKGTVGSDGGYGTKIGTINGYKEIIKCYSSVIWKSGNSYGWITGSFKNGSNMLMLSWVQGNIVYLANYGYDSGTTAYITLEYTKS